MCSWGRVNTWEWARGVGNSWRTYEVCDGSRTDSDRDRPTTVSRRQRRNLLGSCLFLCSLHTSCPQAIMTHGLDPWFTTTTTHVWDPPTQFWPLLLPPNNPPAGHIPQLVQHVAQPGQWCSRTGPVGRTRGMERPRHAGGEGGGALGGVSHAQAGSALGRSCCACGCGCAGAALHRSGCQADSTAAELSGQAVLSIFEF